MSTASEIIADCVAEALALPKDPIQTELRDLALAVYNDKLRIIWDMWPWDNEKLDVFEATSNATTGIVSMPATVDAVRAIREIDASGETDGTRVFSEDELISCSNGAEISSDRFQHVADDATTRVRRIKVEAGEARIFAVLALAKVVPAIVDAAYDSTNPTATPTDYRVQELILDKALPAMKAYIRDALRRWNGIAPEKDGDNLLNIAVKRDVLDNDRERRINPKVPMFSEVGED